MMDIGGAGSLQCTIYHKSNTLDVQLASGHCWQYTDIHIKNCIKLNFVITADINLKRFKQLLQ